MQTGPTVPDIQALICDILANQPTRSVIGVDGVEVSDLIEFANQGHKVVDPNTLTPREREKLVREIIETAPVATILCYPKGTWYTDVGGPHHPRPLTKGLLADRMVWVVLDNAEMEQQRRIVQLMDAAYLAGKQEAQAEMGRALGMPLRTLT